MKILDLWGSDVVTELMAIMRRRCTLGPGSKCSSVKIGKKRDIKEMYLEKARHGKLKGGESMYMFCNTLEAAYRISLAASATNREPLCMRQGSPCLKHFRRNRW